MSLSAFLLPQSSKKGKTGIDKILDDVFSASVLPSGPPVQLSNIPLDKKRKSTEEPGRNTKRSKLETTIPSSPEGSSKRKSSPAKIATHAGISEGTGGVLPKGGGSPSKHSKSQHQPSQQIDTSEEEDEEVSDDPSQLIHESLRTTSGIASRPRHGKPKYVPPEETPEQRDARTVFVGNVAIEVTKSRPTQKQFKRHVLSFVPSAKIESVRFRSVAFNKPTSELPSNDEPKKNTRERDRERASAWRGEDKDESAANPPKRYLTPKAKKRVAYIKQEIHDSVDSVNAYVVFAHPHPPSSAVAGPSDVPAPPPVTDPFEAAQRCAEKCDGSMFMERTLRVDVVKKESRADSQGGLLGDPKATVFVGNLDFASKEEELRAFFETLLCTERGQPGEHPEGESDDEEGSEEEAPGEVKKARTWVKRVRIIRDRDTQLGKGFAYVQFVDRACTDEVLALDQSKLKFAKRKLRVQRCKSLPGGPKVQPPKAVARAPSSSDSKPTSRHGPLLRSTSLTKEIPRGNPALGAKLAHLPKDERKKAKASDPERVARRLAKKQAKALAEKGLKSHVNKVRVRERALDKKTDTQRRDNVKVKKRVRSGKALSKMNTKK